MDEREWTARVRARGGLRTTREARRAFEAALGAWRGALDDDARAVSLALPPHFARVLERTTADARVESPSALYEEAERRERVGLGFATEHAQVVLQVLAEELPPDLVTRLRRRLPAGIAELLQPRAPATEPPPYVHVHPDREPVPAQTLSRARPGPADPIADAQHDLAHAGSVARSDAPHADRMAETARSTRPGREDETLAGSRGPAGTR